MTNTNIETGPAGRAVLQFTIHDRLRKAREHAGMEMGDLAELIGVHRQSIGRYERALATPRRPVLLAWAMATGVDRVWLEKGDQPRSRAVVGNIHSISTGSSTTTTWEDVPPRERPDLAALFVGFDK